MKRTTKKQNLLVLFPRQLSQKNQTLNGLMFLVLKWPKRVSKKQSFCQSGSRSFLTRLVNLGEVSYFMVLQEQVNLIWQRPVLQNVKVPSSLLVLQTWLVSGWVNPNVWLSNFSKWLEIESQPSSLLTKSTPCVAVEVKARTIPLAACSQSSWFKCRVSETIMTVCLSWAQQICLGSWIMLSEDDFRKEFTSRYPTQ